MGGYSQIQANTTMGVDCTVKINTGYLIEVNTLQKELNTSSSSMCDILENLPAGVMYDAQDNYGNLDGEACIFIGLESSEELLFDRKVGYTPLAFLIHQVYTDSEFIKGGAKKYFSFALASIYHGDLEDETEKKEIDEKLENSKNEVVRKIGEILRRKEEQCFAKWLYSYYH